MYQGYTAMCKIWARRGNWLCVLTRPGLRSWYAYTDTSIRVTLRELYETLE